MQGAIGKRRGRGPGANRAIRHVVGRHDLWMQVTKLSQGMEDIYQNMYEFNIVQWNKDLNIKLC